VSYSGLAESMRTALKASATLDAYQFDVIIKFQGKNSCVANADYLIEIHVPTDEPFSTPQNDFHSKTVTETAIAISDPGEQDFDKYVYNFKLYATRHGFTDRQELKGDSAYNSVFDFHRDTQSAISAVTWQDTASVVHYELGPSTFVEEGEGQGNFLIEFQTFFEQQVEIANR